MGRVVDGRLCMVSLYRVGRCNKSAENHVFYCRKQTLERRAFRPIDMVSESFIPISISQHSPKALVSGLSCAVFVLETLGGYPRRVVLVCNPDGTLDIRPQ